MAVHDVVVALDYGPTRDRSKLSLPAIATFSRAIHRINQSTPHSLVLVGITVERPDVGMHSSDGIRMRNEIMARELRVPPSRTLFSNATSSIDEATGVRDLLMREGIEPRWISVVCDRWHARRARMIWEHYFPDNPIEMIRVPCIWNKTSSQPLQRSAWTWALANVAGLIAMKMVGIERMGSFKQPA